MTLTPLLDVLTADAGVSRALTVARSGVANADIAVAAGARPALIAALARESGRPLLAITATTREAEDLASALGCFLEPDRIADFPAWETLPHERLSPRSDTVGKRLAVLRRLAHPDPTDSTFGPLDVVVAPVRAVLQPVARPGRAPPRRAEGRRRSAPGAGRRGPRGRGIHPQRPGGAPQ